MIWFDLSWWNALIWFDLMVWFDLMWWNDTCQENLGGAQHHHPSVSQQIGDSDNLEIRFCTKISLTGNLKKSKKNQEML